MTDLTRRSVLASTAAFPFIGRPAIARGASQAPNIVFIVVDDMNDWCEPLQGYPGIHTPNFTRLARFTRTYVNGFSSVPACNGSRTSALFGLHPFRTGVYDNHDPWPDSPSLQTQKSLPRLLRDAGYRTVGVGKVFHQGWRKEENAAIRDPDAWTDFELCSSAEEGCEEPKLGEYERADRSFRLDHQFIYGKTLLDVEETADAQRAGWFVRNALQSRRDRPVFAALGIHRPHVPLTVPSRFFDLYPPDKVVYPPGALDTRRNDRFQNRDVKDLPPAALRFLEQDGFRDHTLITGGDRNRWKDIVRAYAATVSYTDHCLGIVLDALERSPQRDDTIVVLWSDHGWQLGEKLGWKKCTLWERATRIPFFLGGSIGGKPIRNGKDGAVVSAIDLFPTLCELALGAVPSAQDLGGLPLDGRSFASNVRFGQATYDRALSTWYLRMGRKPPDNVHFAVRSGRHRLIQYANGDRELYDHRFDQWEWNNLMAEPTQKNIAICDDLARELPDPSIMVEKLSRDSVFGTDPDD